MPAIMQASCLGLTKLEAEESKELKTKPMKSGLLDFLHSVSGKPTDS